MTGPGESVETAVLEIFGGVMVISGVWLRLEEVAYPIG